MMTGPRPEVERLRAYRLRSDAPVKLNQNESPADWPAEAKAAVLARVAARAWNRYPAPADELREAFARSAGVSPEMAAVTNGSNEGILAIVETFASGREVVLTVPGYSMSTPLAVVGGARVRAVPLREDFSLDAPAMVEAARAPEAAVVFLASPNNPTGNAFRRGDIEAVIEGAHGIVVVDEAYAHFTGESFLPDVHARSNVIVLRTFSKAFALAGARIGWIVARAELIAAIGKALPPYNLNVFAQEAALAALERPQLAAERVRMIVAERERLVGALRAIRGVEVFPSQTNFILFRTPLPAGTLFERLLARGVLVRDVSAQPMLSRCLRVTAGAPEEDDRFLEALRGSLEGAP